MTQNSDHRATQATEIQSESLTPSTLSLSAQLPMARDTEVSQGLKEDSSLSLLDSGDSCIDESFKELSNCLRVFEDDYAKKRPKEVESKIRLSQLNCQTLTDIKLPEIDQFTKLDHITFFTELNINSKEHLNVITNDINYNWVIIKKFEDDPHVRQRIGLRFPKAMEKDIKVNVLEQYYCLQKDRVANQKDHSTLQYMVFSINIFHLTFKVMLVYKLDDANQEIVDHIFNTMDRQKVHFAVGDFNLDFSSKKIKDLKKDIIRANCKKIYEIWGRS